MYATYISHMGSDNSVCDAARVSMSRKASEFTPEQNSRLITYLAKHNHWSPFSHPQITLHMTAPISIRTQCFKHTIGFATNEQSRRYIDSSPTTYLPDSLRTRPEGSIKQGSGDIHPESDRLLERLSEAYRKALEEYDYLIQQGVAPEQARFVLPQGTNTEWIWTGSLYAYARFYNLRTDSHAQKEIQDLAYQVGSIIEPLYPLSWEALTNVRS